MTFPFSDIFRKHHTLLLTGLILLLALTSVRLIFTDGDEGRYTLLGLAIAEGHGRTDIMLPEPTGDILTPPFYPVVVGAMMKVFGENLVLLKASSLLFFTLAVAFFLRLLRQHYTTSHTALTAAILIGCGNVFVLGMNWMVLAEMWFLLMLVLAWALAEDGGQPGKFRPLGAGVMAGLSVLIRPSGLALLPAGLLHYFTRKRWKDGLIFLGGGLLVNIPTAWNTWKTVGTPVAYLTHYRPEAGAIDGGQGQSSILTIIENMWNMSPTYHFHFVPQHMFFRFFGEGGLLDKISLGFLSAPGAFLIGLLILGGLAVRVWKKQFGMADWSYLGYLALISSYNQPDFAAKGEFFYQDRYLHPLLPLAGIYLVLALQHLPKLPKKFGTGLALACAGYVLLTSLAVSAIRLKTEWQFRGYPPMSPERHLAIDLPEHQGYARFLEAALWARDALPTDAILIARKPRHCYLASRKKSFRPTELNKGRSTWDTWQHYAETTPVYVLQDGYDPSTGYGRDGRATIDPILEANPERFKLVYETDAPVTRVWELVHNPTTER